MVKSDATSEKPSTSDETDGKTPKTASESQNDPVASKPVATPPPPLTQKTTATTPQQRPQQPKQRTPQLQQLQQQQKQRLSLPNSLAQTSNMTPRPTISAISNTVASLLGRSNANRQSLSPQQPNDLPKVLWDQKA